MIDEETFVIVMVAYVYAPKRLTYRGIGIKGHEVLLNAWNEFRKKRPNSRLLLVGGGFDQRGEVHRQRLLDKFNVADDESISWHLGVNDVRSYYAAADVSVSPSLSENHGAALEAGAMGLPSIVTDAGGLPETTDRTCGWQVPAGDSDALVGALVAASDEFASGELRARGMRTRDRIVKLFDQSELARRVADAVDAAADGETSLRSLGDWPYP